MAIAGRPKKLAQDIAEGFMSLSPVSLKPYTPTDLKIILSHLGMVQREIRQIQVAQEDVLLIKAKNTRLTRISQAEMVLRSYCKKKRIPL